MPSHTFYIDIDGGFLDSDIVNIRRKAIDYMWDCRNTSVVVVYSTASKSREVGRIIYTGSYPIFVWKPNGKPSSALKKDGTISRIHL